MDALPALKKVFLFREVPDPILRLLAGCVERRTVQPGESILSEGELSSALFIIGSGSVRAFRAGEPLFLTMGTGESFGQVSLLQGGPSPLSAVATEPTELLVLRAALLRDRLADNHEVGHALYQAVARSLAARLQRAVDALELARGAK